LFDLKRKKDDEELAMNKNKNIVLITGTSSGFGFLAAIQLAQQGYHVIATMRDKKKEALLITEAKKLNITENLEVLELDVTNRDQISKVKNYIEEHYGKIDVLINNAGYCVGGMTELIDMDEWVSQFETNVFSVVAVTKAFLPMMRTRRKGKIINIGSISGRFGFPAMGAYAASKWALAGFSESLRLELMPFNVHVCLIEAGSFKTDIWEKSLKSVQKTDQNGYEQYVQFIYEQAEHTAKHAEKPDEVINLITKICATKKPKLRYQIGKGVKFQILCKTILPWSWIEWLFFKNMKKLFKK
jgi:NAD(P)-dependent dehydrogenase (short-subunit alcohol dehydrogenase family)